MPYIFHRQIIMFMIFLQVSANIPTSTLHCENLNPLSVNYCRSASPIVTIATNSRGRAPSKHQPFQLISDIQWLFMEERANMSQVNCRVNGLIARPSILTIWFFQRKADVHCGTGDPTASLCTQLVLLQNRKLLIFHGLTVASLSCPF